MDLGGDRPGRDLTCPDEAVVTVADPDVSVVIPYYDDQARLTLLLRALAQQQCDTVFEVVVADDGSPEPPVVPPDLLFACTVVRQSDNGFRAAAARNLGADNAAGRWLLFLDGDTLPSSGYVRSMVHRLRAIDDGHGALVVGRRRHADLSTADTATVLDFLRGDPTVDTSEAPGIRLLDDPRWLSDGYARTDNLRSASDEDFRLVISAVLGVDRRLWERTGGFDGAFVGYGGEDWDFGWRAWLAGADWAHEPGAVAWHDGPDAGGRGLDPVVKNAESLQLAMTIPLPSVRGAGLIHAQPDIVVRFVGPITGTAADASAVACIDNLLAQVDGGVWLPRCNDSGSAATGLPPILAGDPRVHAGDPPPQILDRARYRVTVERPMRLAASLNDCCALGEWGVPGLLQIRRTRALRRLEPAPTGVPHPESLPSPAVQPISDDLSLERWWAGW